METKSSNLYTRIEPNVMKRIENIKSSIGFAVDYSTSSDEIINKELEKGYEDMRTGRTKSALKVFDDIIKD